MRPYVLLPFAGLLAFNASAAISVTSRTSYAYYWQQIDRDIQFPVVTTSNDTKTGTGVKTVSANGNGFTSTVDDTGITSLKMRGTNEGTANSPNRVMTQIKMKLDVTLAVTGAGAKVDVLMSGNTFGGGWYPGIAPESQNAYIAIFNTATNAVVFDSAAIGVFNSGFHTGRTWSNAAWSGMLAAGTYRIGIGTHGNIADDLGPGAGYRGTGNLDARLTFTALVPSPGALPLFASLFILNRRRR